MRKLMPYLFLALYLNTAVFSPVKGGRAIDTVNSAVEFLVQKVLSYKDPTPDDEEEQSIPTDTTSQVYTIDCMPAPCIYLEKPEHGHYTIIHPPIIHSQLPIRTMDILTPPPDVA